MTIVESSAHDAFAAVAGSCRAPFSWDASAAGVSIKPASGQTQLQVSVTLDESSARVLEPPGMTIPGYVGCAPSLVVDADVAIESDDGSFVEHERVTLSYRKSIGVALLRFNRASNELGGSLTIEAPANQKVTLEFSASGAGSACAGELGITVSETTPTRSSTSGGSIGKWTNTGCPLSNQALRLDGSDAVGKAIRANIEQLWGSASYAGVWDDGVQTNFQLNVTLNAELACVPTAGLRIADVPVRVSYGSDDERITMHATDAHVNAFLSADGGVTQLQLVLSEDMMCASRTDAIAYARASCRDLSAVTAQLLLNHYATNAAEFDGKLEVYRYKGASMSGPADDVQRLMLHEH
jgi:hypothetical protein